MFTQTLILNQQYRPHELVDWKKAMTKMLNGKLEVLVEYDEVMAHIDSHTLDTFPKLRRALRQVMMGATVGMIEVKVPAVAVLTRKLGNMKSGVKFSRPNVCLRDEFRCQYCGNKLPMSKLNYDHVIPRSKGGPTVWENIVASCYPCNDKKANRTPEEAGMTLLSMPKKPQVLPMRNDLRIDPEKAPIEWAPYIVRAA